jgi:RimJ/RimL family protein N-acetyltransferase
MSLQLGISMTDQQVIYSMMRVGRIHPPNRQVLRDISLGFFYGAKIGVLGLNGAGKSTLLRIMAGLDEKHRNIEFRRIVIGEKGKGIGRKAIQKVKHFCFEDLKCHRIWLDVIDTNERAKHLYLSEGFKEEGKLRDCLMANGELKSLIIMSILENEYHTTN